MTIICGPINATISGSDSMVCNTTMHISNIRYGQSTIDVDVLNFGTSAQVSSAGNTFTVNGSRCTIALISKNESAYTAVIQITVSDIPPEKWKCIDPITNTCAQATDGIYNSEADCKAALSCQPPPAGVTHYLDVIVQPYSWYTPGETADWMVTKLTDISGAITNIFTGITDYEYVRTDILPNEPVGKVTVRINLRQTSTMGINSMVVIPVAVWVAAIVSTLLVIFVAFGIITGWTFKLSGFLAEITGKEYSKKDVVDMVEGQGGVVDKQRADCKLNFAGNPDGLASCEKSVQSGAADGLTDSLGLTGTDSTTLGIADKIDTCLSQYHADNDADKYQKCLDGVAASTASQIKAKTPETPSGGMGTMLLLGVGLLGIMYLSKGGEGKGQTIVVEREKPKQIEGP